LGRVLGGSAIQDRSNPKMMVLSPLMHPEDRRRISCIGFA
jgi:hypothetical protein